MKAKKKNGVVEHTASTFDSFLEDEGIREEVEAVAVKRVISWQLAEANAEKKENKTGPRKRT
jgi:antitoxin HicB